MVIPEDKSKQLELKKHINAIHCSNNLSLVQRKLFNALLFHAYSDLPIKAKFTVPIKELCLLIGYNSHDYDKLKKAVVDLMSIVIEWNVIEYSTSNSNQKWNASSILAAVTLERGVCHYEYSSTLKELLYRPEFYGRICLQTQSKFKSSYGLALYENCIRYKGIPQTPWYSLDIFRKLMGVSKDKYKVFKDFKKRVIDIAVAEVNEHSNIIVVLEVKKQDKMIAAIRFKLLEKSTNLFDHKDEKQTSSSLISILSDDFRFAPDSIRQMLESYSQEYIQEKIDLIINSRSYKTGKIHGLAGYLLDALKKDYKACSSTIDLLKLKKNAVEKEVRVKDEQLQETRRAYTQYLLTALDDYVTALSTSSREEIIKEFVQDAEFRNDLLTIKEYEKNGLSSLIVKENLAAFFVRRRIQPEVFICHEEYLKIDRKLPQGTSAG